MITDKTAVVAIAQMSNVLGTIYPLEDVIAYAHQKGAVVVVDGAQSVPHLPTDVQALDADFLAFSGHKMFGPWGLGFCMEAASSLRLCRPFTGWGNGGICGGTGHHVLMNSLQV